MIAAGRDADVSRRCQTCSDPSGPQGPIRRTRQEDQSIIEGADPNARRTTFTAPDLRRPAPRHSRISRRSRSIVAALSTSKRSRTSVSSCRWRTATPLIRASVGPLRHLGRSLVISHISLVVL